MIKSLDVVNFQSHRASSVEFHPGINVFVGESDTGKSALLRALEWLDTNRPIGDWMQTHGTKQTVVSVVTDASSVSRQRGGVNEYKAGDQSFTAFGTSVPNAVVQALGLTDLNFASQHSPPFLISMPATQASKYLNEIVRLDKIDTAVDKVTASKKAAEAIYKVTEAKLAQAQDTYGKLGWVDEAVELDKELTTALDKIQDIEGEHLALSALHTNLANTLVQRVELEEELLVSSAIYEELLSIDKAITAIDRECKDLDIMISNLVRLREAQRGLTEELDSLPPESVCKMCGRAL